MNFLLEELSINAWPAIHTLLYDGWVIRLSNGYGNRANSVSPLYPSKINLDEKIAYCDGFFSRHNLPVAYKLVGCKEHEGLESRFEKIGYKKINETSVQTCEIAGMTGKNPEGIIITENFDEPWIKSVIEFNKIEEQHVQAFRAILKNIAMEKFVVCKEAAGEIVGCGYGAIGGGYAGVFDIVVRESFRGKGYGREIVESIHREAYKRGAEKAFLQVMLNNPVALNLYKKLGYKEAYKYWYRKKSLILTPQDNY